MTTITVTVYSSHLTNEDIPADELKASADNYAAELADEINEEIGTEYPNVEVTIDVEHNVSGVGSGVSVVDDNAEQADTIKGAVERIAERVFAAGRFWV